MTTQLQNQDPFAPMDNGDFIAQMAQFSTVTGIQEMNTSIGKLVEEFDQARIATASNLLGHSVLVPGNIGRADENGELHGVLDLPDSTILTQLTYIDADTNAELHVEDLGPRSAGLVGFKWSDIPEEILKSRDPSQAIPPLYGALLKNEQDVHMLQRLAFMARRESSPN